MTMMPVTVYRREGIGIYVGLWDSILVLGTTLQLLTYHKDEVEMRTIRDVVKVEVGRTS